MAAMRKLPVVLLCRRPTALPKTPNQLHSPAVPPHQEGRFAIVTNVEAGCDGRGGARDECASRGRQSRVVLTTRRWRQVGGAIRRRWWQESPVTRESAE